MKTLSNNWLTEDLIDAEYKRYILLAYLADVQQNFNAKKLYPQFADLIAHYTQLIVLKENAQSLYNSFPDQAKQFDWENLRINYDKIVQNDVLMAELEQIIDFSIPQFQTYLKQGRELYDYIESHLKVEPVGVVPLYVNEGYMFMLKPNTKETAVYEYQVTIFTKEKATYRQMYTEHIDTYRWGVINTPENLKSELIKQRPKLPNPAVYTIETLVDIPFAETYLPIAKRVLVKKLAA